MTKYVVRYTVEAQEDLKSIYAYIAFHLKERATAQKLVNEIRKEIRSLDVMPERYTRVDWEPWASEGMRKFPVSNFDAFFGSGTFSKKWLKPLGETIIERDATAYGLSRYRLRDELLYACTDVQQN